MDAGPEESNTGYSGWKQRDVIEDGCMRGIALVCCISMTSGRSFVRLAPLCTVLVKDPASCNMRAKGSVDNPVSSTSISLEDIEESEPADDLRRRFAGLEECCAHSGSGFRRSYCLLNRLVYSLPLTKSSSSLMRSFRSRVSLASEISIRSSALSSHAGLSLSVAASGKNIELSTADGPESTKNS